METALSRTQGPNNDQVDEFLNSIQDVQYRVILIKVKSNNKETHETGRCFKQCLIGRGSDADYTVNDKACSRKHCIIYFRQDRLAIRDLYSRSGTFVNGVRIPPFEDFFLLENDVIQINEDSIVVQHINNINVVDPAPANVQITQTKDVLCPYCSKQQYQLINDIDSLKKNIAQMLTHIQTQRKEQAVLNQTIEMSVRQMKDMEKQQQIIFVETRPKTPTFKRDKSKHDSESTVIDKSIKNTNKKVEDELKIEDMEVVKKSKSGLFGRLFKSQKNPDEKKDDGTEQSKSVKKSWFGRSKSAKVTEPQQQDTQMEQPKEEAKMKKSWFRRSVSNVKEQEHKSGEPADVKKSWFSRSRGPTEQHNEVPEKTTQPSQPHSPVKKSGFFSKLFSKSQVQESKAVADEGGVPEYVFENDERLE